VLPGGQRGFLGAIFSGAGFGYLKDFAHGNWALVFWVLAALPLIPATLMASIWNARPNERRNPNPRLKSRFPPVWRKPGLFYEARRRLEALPGVSKLSPGSLRRVSGESPVCLP
jgi:hypothetical protein